MAKKDENTAEGGIKPEDAMFMAECLRHLQTPANVDVKGVATALNYKNSASVANRIRALKKKFDLQLGCTGHTGGDGPAAASTSSPRKGAAANRGPIKATTASDEASETEDKAAKSGSGGGAKKTRPSRQRAVKSAAKAKDSTDEEEAEEEET